MPTYQYTCTACAEPLEAVQAFHDAPLTVCPACGGTLRKVFSAVGVVFKGSGFYKNDSRSSSASKPAAPKTDAAPAAATTKSDSTSSGSSTSTSTPSTPAASST